MRVIQEHVEVSSRKEWVLTENMLSVLSSVGALPKCRGVEVGRRGVLQG